MNSVKTPAQRKAAERQRLRDAGLVAVTVWIDPADRAKLAHYIKRLNQRRSPPPPPDTAQKKAGRAKVQPWDAEHYNQPLYAVPLVPLTDEQLNEIYGLWDRVDGNSYAALMRMVEAAHGIAAAGNKR